MGQILGKERYQIRVKPITLRPIPKKLNSYLENKKNFTKKEILEPKKSQVLII
jgi:hypothetical protein